MIVVQMNIYVCTYSINTCMLVNMFQTEKEAFINCPFKYLYTEFFLAIVALACSPGG